MSDFAKQVGPNTWERPRMSQHELAATQAQCETEIKSFYKKVEEWAGGKDTFHGHWIRTVHAKHLAEEISYQLFIEGMPFGVGSGAVRLFTLPQQVKMLWSGTPPDVRDQWKKKEHAGELSKETAFGKAVEAAGTLKSCDFGGVLTFWEAASGSFLNIDREKPVLVLINKTRDAIESTSLWRAEIPALARSPPPSDLRLLTWQMPCLDLVLLLEGRIKEVVGPNVGSQNRWIQRSGVMTCEHVDSSSSATRYPPPFWTGEQLLERGFKEKELKHLGFGASWFRGRGFKARILNKAGFKLKELIMAGVSSGELRKCGFPQTDIERTLKQLKESGYSARQLNELGFSSEDLRMAGFTFQDLRKGGFTINQMKEELSAANLVAAGFTVRELRENGFSAKELKEGGVSATQLRDAGFSWNDLVQAGFSSKSLRKAGCKDCEDLTPDHLARKMREEGKSAKQLIEKGFTPKVLSKVGFSLRELTEAGLSARDLKHAGFSPKELAHKFPAKELYPLFRAKQLKSAGLSIEELKDAGVPAIELRDAGFDGDDLVLGGFSVKEMRAAGYSDEELKKMGFSPHEIKHANAKSRKRSGKGR